MRTTLEPVLTMRRERVASQTKSWMYESGSVWGVIGGWSARSRALKTSNKQDCQQANRVIVIEGLGLDLSYWTRGACKGPEILQALLADRFAPKEVHRGSKDLLVYVLLHARTT